MISMENSKVKFYALVKGGLWGKLPSDSNFDGETDWTTIYNYSRQQALLGNVLDGINLLPEEQRPPRPLYLKWCAEVLQIEDENQRMDKEVVNLFKMLRENGVNPILMKGQAIARNYPDPLHRISGDIDIYIGKKDYDKVNSLLAIEGKQLEKWSPKHVMFEWHNVIVENHRLLAKMDSPVTNRKFYRIIDEGFQPSQVSKIEIEGYNITIPSVDFDVMFLLLHSVIHLMGYGVGLRQICDWAMLLHNKKDEINPDVVKRLLKSLTLTKSARVFGALAVKYLGLPKENLILPYSSKDEKVAEKVLEDIWYSGNFGFSGERIKKYHGNWVTVRLKNLYHGTKRAMELRKIAPSEAYWKPYKILNHFIKSRIDK